MSPIRSDLLVICLHDRNLCTEQLSLFCFLMRKLLRKVMVLHSVEALLIFYPVTAMVLCSFLGLHAELNIIFALWSSRHDSHVFHRSAAIIPKRRERRRPPPELQLTCTNFQLTSAQLPARLYPTSS